MILRYWWILGLATLLLMGMMWVGCEDDKTDGNGDNTLQPVDLLPQDGEISGWAKGSGEGDFQEAYDEGSLYDIIDGGAVTYINHGMESAVQQVYQGTVGTEDADLYLFITDQGSAGNCENLFNESTILPPSGSVIDDLGDEALVDRSPLFQIVLYFREDSFFVRITIDKQSDPDAAENIAMLFARNVEEDIP